MVVIQPVRDENGVLIGYRCIQCGETAKVTNLNGVCNKCQKEQNIKDTGDPKVGLNN